MYVGLLTDRFPKETSFPRIVSWAGQAGFRAIEIGRCLPPAEILTDGGKAVRKLLDDAGLRVSSLALYGRWDLAGEEYPAALREGIDAAGALGAEVVCTLAGFPAEGKTKMQTIREVLPGVLGPLAEYAAGKGIRIAFENWFATNLQNLEHFRAVVEAVPNDNVGFNFDPSHLYWQQIDYLAAVEEFADRIFHTHAKDVAIRTDRLRRVGVLERNWWRYVIPGYGEIDWGRFLLALREIGYDGVLSVEHEDRAFEPEEGFAKALRHLSQFV